MHKKVELNLHDFRRVQIPQFPHCDQRVLHAPGECEFCDKHPDWQALRFSWGIAFTGWTPDGKELPCPATAARGNPHTWSGNTPWPHQAPLQEVEAHIK